MKKIFRKAVTVLGSTALIGATVAMAAAASYPEPFTSNTAIVVGANAAPSDNIAAASIASNLDANAVSGAITVTDGDSYQFTKSSTKFHLGDNFQSIRTNINDEHLTTLLADGKYVDDDNDEFDYTQKVVMAAEALTLFEDGDYKDDVPTVGFKIDNGDNLLNYTLTFSDTPLFSDIKTTTLPLMGKDYYVLSNGTSIIAGSTKLTLLDSAADAIVAEGETVTITAGGKSYTVSIEFVDSNSAKLNVNGEITNDIGTASTYKLDDGSYLGMKEILYSAKDTGISKVEFSIGSGKLILTDGSEVELNDETITGLTATINNDSTATKLTSIVLQWDAEDDLFVTEDSSVTMPGFEALGLSFTGMDYPAEEEISVDVSNDRFTLSNFPLDDGTANIDLYYVNESSGKIIGYGKDADDLLLISAGTNLTWDSNLHQYFVASWNDTTDSSSYLMRATSFVTESNTDKVTFQYMKDGSWTDAKSKGSAGDEVTLGDLTLTLGAVSKTSKTVNFWGGTGASFDTLYSKEGMAITLGLVGTLTDAKQALPANSTFAGNNVTSMTLTFNEEDKSDNLASGGSFTMVLGSGGTSTYTASVTAVSGLNGTSLEVENSDVYRQFEYSELATEVLYDKTDANAKKATVIYHGEEVSADVYITSADAISTTDAGVMTVMDDAVSTVSGKNLVVVGGSAINTVAADLLGGALSEAAFTSATGVAAGEFLIQSFDRSGKTALLVAGYNAADTEKAVTYLLNNDVDTTVGMKMKGTSATEASLVTA